MPAEHGAHYQAAANKSGIPDSSASGARGARAAREPGVERELAVRNGLAETDRGDRLPHGLLKRRAFGGERGLEALALAAEVFGQLALRLTQRRVARIAPPIRLDLRK